MGFEAAIKIPNVSDPEIFRSDFVVQTILFGFCHESSTYENYVRLALGAGRFDPAGRESRFI